MSRPAAPVTALCGGVGAARLLRGLQEVVAPGGLVAVVNVGDDCDLHGLSISPDLDTITYTVSGQVDGERGWGLVDETWTAMAALDRFAAVRPAGSVAGATWFALGDRDLATHLYRTGRRAEGAPLSTVTAEVAAAHGLAFRLLPVTDDRLRTHLRVAAEGQPGQVEDLDFQSWFVGRRHRGRVTEVRFEGAEAARPAPGVMEALAAAGRIVLCPSNPLVSVAPLLAVAAVRQAVEDRRADVVAVSPIVAGAALKGPAATLLADLGHEVSVVGVARLYAGLAATLVVDEADAARAGAVEAEGLRCVVAPTVMHDRQATRLLAEIVCAC
ncbi:MAG: 2-phospho-L-lactate transferase [Acidimicrobiales bacterium]